MNKSVREQATRSFHLTSNPDQVYGLELISSKAFDGLLAALNNQNLTVATTIVLDLTQKIAAGWLLTPLTREMLELAEDVCVDNGIAGALPRMH